jgi:hypothetical protein
MNVSLIHSKSIPNSGPSSNHLTKKVIEYLKSRIAYSKNNSLRKSGHEDDPRHLMVT